MTTANTTLEMLANKISRYAFDSDSNVQVCTDGSNVISIYVYDIRIALLGCIYTQYGWELDEVSSVTTLPPSGFQRIFNRICDK